MLGWRDMVIEPWLSQKRVVGSGEPIPSCSKSMRIMIESFLGGFGEGDVFGFLSTKTGSLAELNLPANTSTIRRKR